jgi:outer membrane protein assembly factor BamB
MEADINTGVWIEVYKVEGGDSIRQGLEVPSFYIEDDGDTLLVFSNTEAWFEKNVIIPNLLCYNQTKDSLYYDILLDEPAVGNAVDWFPIIVGDRVYLSVNRKMVCHNVLTGEQLWVREMNANILGSNFIIVDDHIYTQTEGWEPSLWKIDAINGDILWSSPSRGGNSFLNYYEGKIYQVTGGRLKVVDAMSGIELASIKAPSSYVDDNDFFSGRCTVDPETGYVYVTSFSTAYCYPPLE